MSLPNSQPAKRHLLTIALEDYFQVGAFNQVVQNRQWYRFEPRLEHNTRKTLALLERYNIKATFFVLGWVAHHFPDVVRMVAQHGHEVASKGYYHRSIRDMSPEEFREDLKRAREAIERAAQKRVLGYRVSHQWFQIDDLWALDVLAEEGYAYDSSISPLFRRYSAQPWRRFAHLHESGGRAIWEFPLSSASILGCHMPTSGGNYFRQFPHWLMCRAVARWDRKYEAPFVMYFHVWELDPDQPHIHAASWLSKIRHYRNLHKMEGILEDYFERYQFGSVAGLLGLNSKLDEQRQKELARVTILDSAESLPGIPLHGAELPPPPPPSAPAAPAPKTPVTIVIPCYNEELIVPYLANTLKRVNRKLGPKYDLHFTFVNDGSKDATLQQLRTTFGATPGCTVLSHAQNQGVAAAILTGIRNAETELVCSIDCDCTYDPHELAAMIPLMTPDVDMVTASPYHRRGQVRNVPGWRLSLSKSASFLYRRVLHQKLATYTSCCRVYRRQALADLDLREKGYLGIAEMLGLLDLRGGRIVEHPATLDVRMLGRSKMKVLLTIGGHLRLLTRLFFRRIFGIGTKRVNPLSDAAANLPETRANLSPQSGIRPAMKVEATDVSAPAHSSSTVTEQSNTSPPSQES